MDPGVLFHPGSDELSVSNFMPTGTRSPQSLFFGGAWFEHLRFHDNRINSICREAVCDMIKSSRSVFKVLPHQILMLLTFKCKNYTRRVTLYMNRTHRPLIASYQLQICFPSSCWWTPSPEWCCRWRVDLCCRMDLIILPPTHTVISYTLPSHVCRESWGLHICPGLPSVTTHEQGA